jgi:DinB superfamily
VVAFRTYLRTLLHEVGHHLDYALLRLRDSYHTEGFYKRESSLFHQLVAERRARSPGVEEWFRRTPDERLARLASTPGEMASVIERRSARALARRPAPDAWAPVEVICHVRDTEELFGDRVAAILSMHEPSLPSAGPSDRWADERQYRRHDAATALAHFRRRRGESLETLVALSPSDWQRGGEHPARGRLSIDLLVALMASHDDTHLEQLTRAVEGKP